MNLNIGGKGGTRLPPLRNMEGTENDLPPISGAYEHNLPFKNAGIITEIKDN